MLNLPFSRSSNKAKGRMRSVINYQCTESKHSHDWAVTEQQRVLANHSSSWAVGMWYHPELFTLSFTWAKYSKCLEAFYGDLT